VAFLQVGAFLPARQQQQQLRQIKRHS
jgi:hypothetical protein